MSRTLLSLMLVVFLVSCSDDDSDAERGPRLRVSSDPSLFKRLTPGGSGAGDYFNLLDFKIRNDTAFVLVSYWGGCLEHYYDLVWEGKVLNTIPSSTRFALIHDSNTDFCIDRLSDTLAFGLSDLLRSIKENPVTYTLINGYAPEDSIVIIP